MTDQFANIALEALVSSPTNPRKNFNPIKLQELADSIKASGVHQPILVRQLPAQRLLDTAHLKPRPTHEIVAGERRYRGSNLAGVATIPVMIRELTDDQVLEIQIVENIQRDSLTELETAEGYKTLMDHNHLTADEVGQKVSKSRSSIYGTLKLLDLHPYGKECLREDSITASHALLIARISDVKLQHKAVDYAAAADDNGHKPSIRAFQQWLRDNVMLDLDKAPFPITVKTLTTAGSCEDCDKRTGANPDLFTDVKSADVCTHPPCYHLKVEAHKTNLAAMVKAIPKETNKNVDNQQGLGLVSTLAQDARAQLKTAEATQREIEIIKNRKAIDIHKAQRVACYDALIDYIYECDALYTATLLPIALLRTWLQRQTFDWDADDLATALDMPPMSEDEAEGLCKLRIERADDADILRYAAAMLLLPDRDTQVGNSQFINQPLLINNFAAALKIDLEPICQEAADQVEAETKAKIAALNKQIKAAKTTSTPPPAGAAIDDAAADAKKPKPAALPRKAKTTTEEAKLGIAAAMQSIEVEPLDASLGGSEAAAIDMGKLMVGSLIRVVNGKHVYKEGTIIGEVSSDMWNVSLPGGATGMFSTYLPTKSLEVRA